MTRIAGIVDPVCDCILHVRRNPLVGDKGRGAEIAESKPDSNQLNRISIDMLLLPHLKQRKHMMTHSATLPSIVTHAPLSHDTTFFVGETGVFTMSPSGSSIILRLNTSNQNKVDRSFVVVIVVQRV